MKKSKRHTNVRRAGRPRVRATEHATHKNHRAGETRRELVKGLICIAVVLAIKLYVESTPFGHRLELMSYNLLQSRLSTQSVPFTIVDISNLPEEQFDVDGRVGVATPRGPLREMIQAAADQGAKAIAVDIDFAPDKNGYIHPRDPDFFRFCLGLRRQGVPVFLGIRRTLDKPQAEWLGGEEYKDLAANIIIPDDTHRMNSLIRVELEGAGHGAAESGAVVSKSMSVLLAEAYGRPRDEHTASGRLHEAVVEPLEAYGLIERMSEKQLTEGLSAEDFLVDYGPLESIETIETTDANVLRDTSNRKRLQGRVVLFGDATLGKAADTFLVPDRDHPYPGVFLHACAAYTMLKAPLYEVTPRGRITVDIAMSLGILLCIVVIGHRQPSEESRVSMTNRARGLLTLLIVVTSIAVGVIFVRVTRIMWDDFFLALLLLVFHPSIEKHLEGWWEYLRKSIFKKS